MTEDRPGWRPEEASPATGGHLTSGASGYDPLTAPLPSEQAASRTDVSPRAREGSSGPRDSRRRPTTRRLKRTIRHVDPLSVLKISLFLYTCFLILWLIIVAILYSFIESMGLFDTIEEVADAFAFNWDANISLMFVERWAFLIGLTLVVVGSLVNLFVAFLYNVAADTIGGVETTFAERDV